jgi:hypothetical protein
MNGSPLHLVYRRKHHRGGDERGFGALAVVLGVEQYRLRARTDPRRGAPSQLSEGLVRKARPTFQQVSAGHRGLFSRQASGREWLRPATPPPGIRPCPCRVSCCVDPPLVPENPAKSLVPVAIQYDLRGDQIEALCCIPPRSVERFCLFLLTFSFELWWRRRDSNPRHRDYDADEAI